CLIRSPTRSKFRGQCLLFCHLSQFATPTVFLRVSSTAGAKILLKVANWVRRRGLGGFFVFPSGSFSPSDVSFSFVHVQYFTHKFCQLRADLGQPFCNILVHSTLGNPEDAGSLTDSRVCVPDVLANLDGALPYHFIHTSVPLGGMLR